MSIKQLILLLAFVGLSSVVSLAQNVRFTYDRYDEALEKAKAEDKLVFIDTYASWCKPCKKQEPVFWDRELAKFFNEHFINVKINMDNRVGKSLSVKHSIVFLPTLMILDHNENVRYRSDQSVSADILTVEELLAIAKSMVDPSTLQPSPKKELAQVEQTSEPKYRHVQHTPLPQNNTVSQPTVRKESKEQDVSSGEEKILYVLGENDNLPPEILKQEAYFRLSLMDGSHKEKAKEYLASQEDWSTEENMKFLFDFLYNSRSDEFNYLIINRHKFNAAIGEENVNRTVGILVQQTLERGFPQPDLEEVRALFSYIDPSSSRRNGTKYFLDRMLKEEKIEDFVKMAPSYLKDINQEDHETMYNLAVHRVDTTSDKKEIKENIKLLEQAFALNDTEYKYVDLLAQYHFRLSDKTEALKYAKRAIELAKVSQIDYASTLKLIENIDNL